MDGARVKRFNGVAAQWLKRLRSYKSIGYKLRHIIMIPGKVSVSYLYITIAGFPISKSRKPKSVVLKEFILKISCPAPGING